MRVLSILLVAMLLLNGTAFAEQNAKEKSENQLTASGYVCITCGEQSRWYPLPADGAEDYEMTVRQTTTDGEQISNTLHFTSDGVYMAASTCENQDCVGEGIVTLENKETRVLGSWIICLPQQVSAELYSLEEVLAMQAGQE